MKITHIHAREILDSKSNPTIETTVSLADDTIATAAVPSGASTGNSEAFEMRDNDSKRYKGKGVLKAVSNVNEKIQPHLVNQDVSQQKVLDQIMIDLDGTENKSNLGGNTILSVSMTICKAAALSQKIPLYQYFGLLSENTKFELPQPQILLLEGGKHGNWSTDLQEFFVIPQKDKFSSFREMLRAGAEIFQTLGKILQEKKYATGVGYEGAFCPPELRSNEEALELIMEATKKSGYQFPGQMVLGIDGAASEFFSKGKYHLKNVGTHPSAFKKTELTSRQWSEKIIAWTQKYPIWSLEDMLHEEDWTEWTYLTSQLGKTHQIIGDDLLTTNVKRIQKAIDQKAVNSVLIKPNQIGTITETLNAIKLADEAGFTTVISHRGGETNDDLIADLVVGTTAKQCKFGGPDRGERLAKYNRLLKIEEELER